MAVKKSRRQRVEELETRGRPRPSQGSGPEGGEGMPNRST